MPVDWAHHLLGPDNWGQSVDWALTLITKAIPPPPPQSDEFTGYNEVAMDLQGCAQTKLSAGR